MTPVESGWALAFEVEGPRLRVWSAAGAAGAAIDGFSASRLGGPGVAGVRGAGSDAAPRANPGERGVTVLAEAGRHSQHLAEAVLQRGARPVQAVLPPIPAVVVVHDAATGELQITTSASPGSSVVFTPTGAGTGAGVGPGTGTRTGAGVGPGTGSWAFANHLPTLFARTGQQPPIDPAAVAAWLMVARGSGTVYRGLQWLPAGATLTLRPGGTPQVRQWVSVEESPAFGTVEEFVEQYCAALDEVLATEAPTEGGVSVLMSAGLDSTMVAGSLAGVVGPERAVHAYCLDPELPVAAADGASGVGDSGVAPGAIPGIDIGWLYSDFPDAMAMGRAWANLDVSPLRNAAGLTWLDVLPQVFATTGSPVFNPSNAIWMYEAALRARHSGHGVLFTGQSGNRTFSWQPPRPLHSLLFAGKPGAMIDAMRAHSNATGMPMWRETGRLLTQVAPWTREMFHRRRGFRAGGARAVGETRTTAERIAAATYLAPGALDALDLYDVSARSAFAPGPGWFRPGYFGTGISLPLDPLPEVRLADPLSALPLVRIVAALPTEAFVGVGDGRSFARRAMLGRVPDNIRLRVAKGLQAPDSHRWMPTAAQVGAALDAAARVPGIAETIDLARVRADINSRFGAVWTLPAQAERALGAVLFWLWRQDPDARWLH